MVPKGVTGRYAEKFMLPWPALCLYWTPQMDYNPPARGGIMMYNGGLAGG